MCPQEERHTVRIYLASPLFTQVERRWNRELARRIEKALPGSRVILPQDFTVKSRFNDKRHFGVIFRRCIEEIDKCDVMVAVLDGADSDSGTAFEVGYAYAQNKPIIGVRTDFRQGQEKGLNIMLCRACTHYIADMSFREDLELIVKDLLRKMKRIFAEIERNRAPSS